MAPYKKYNATKKRHGPQPGEKKNRDDGRGPLQCLICGKGHRKKDCPLYHGDKP